MSVCVCVFVCVCVCVCERERERERGSIIKSKSERVKEIFIKLSFKERECRGPTNRKT